LEIPQVIAGEGPWQAHLISVQRSDGVFPLETDGLFEGL